MSSPAINFSAGGSTRLSIDASSGDATFTDNVKSLGIFTSQGATPSYVMTDVGGGTAAALYFVDATNQTVLYGSGDVEIQPATNMLISTGAGSLEYKNGGAQNFLVSGGGNTMRLNAPTGGQLFQMNTVAASQQSEIQFTYGAIGAPTAGFSLYRPVNTRDLGFYNYQLAKNQIYCKSSDGFVGINTTAPAAQLHVVGTTRLVSASTDAVNAALSISAQLTGVSVEAFQGNAPGTKRPILLNGFGGSVGIGVDTAPNKIFEVKGTESFAAMSTNPIGATMVLTNTNGGQRLYLGSYFTAGVNAGSAIQSANFFSAVDNPSILVLQPLGGAVLIGTNTENPSTSAGPRRLTIKSIGSNTGVISFYPSFSSVAYTGIGYDETNDGLAIYHNYADLNLNQMPVFFKRNVNAGGAYSSANACMWILRDTTTLRSINAAGTVNANGADYAEYLEKDLVDDVIAKGDIVGIKPNGKLTKKWSEAKSFLIKSTNPSFVGGDSWASDIGTPPPKPDDASGDNDIMHKWKYDTIVYEAKMEAARAKVDRMAYSGQVPVSVYGATAGDYIIAIQGENDSITGTPISEDEMTFAEYKKAIGRVIKVLPDGRARVNVIVH